MAAQRASPRLGIADTEPPSVVNRAGLFSFKGGPESVRAGSEGGRHGRGAPHLPHEHYACKIRTNALRDSRTIRSDSRVLRIRIVLAAARLRAEGCSVLSGPAGFNVDAAFVFGGDKV